MSPCADKEGLLGGLLDGELDAANAAAVEEHLKTCPGCAQAYGRMQALRRLIGAAGVRESAPPSLRARIEADIEAAPAPARPARAWLPWSVSAATAAIAASLALAVMLPSHELAVQDEVVSGHIRSLEVSHLMDVASTDRHTVKPWFNGRLDFGLPTPDLAARGFPLAGGRLDYLHQRTAAALVYRRRQHVINVFVWPARNGEAPSGAARRRGYSIVYWTAGGLEFWAVSDIDPGELETFHRAFLAEARPS